MHEFRPPAVVEADAELLRTIRRGDTEAIGELVRRQGRFVYAARDRRCRARSSRRAHTGTCSSRRGATLRQSNRAGAFRPWLAQLTLRIAEHEGLDVPTVSTDQLSDTVVTELVGAEAEWPALPPELGD